MNTLALSGYNLGIKMNKDWVWTLRNVMRPSYIWGAISVAFAKLFSKITDIVTITSEVRAWHLRDGVWTDLGVLGQRCVTTAGVNWLVDCFQDADHTPADIYLMKFHGVGIGTAAEAVGDTALATECTTQYDTDNTRPTGTVAEGATNNIYRSVGTVVFTYTGGATTAITEHGLFNQAANSGGTLWDRTVFAAINVVNTDTIAFTYQATFNSGG
jgi:hypothetical protein